MIDFINDTIMASVIGLAPPKWGRRGNFNGNTDPFTEKSSNNKDYPLKFVYYYYMSDPIPMFFYVFTYWILTTTLGEGNGGPEKLSRHWNITQVVSGGAGVHGSAVEGPRSWGCPSSWDASTKGIWAAFAEAMLGWEALWTQPLARVFPARWEKTHLHNVDVVIFL